ncbi:transcriptional regulator, ArsR family [Natronincola peptidivorans]|uniref:Transcriptional regulator, ArsR family n=1 Tax=Natronincola peptidivorans TaxID=426128 RepID=A0A1I0D9S5_9FIRM|nr:metalloregulator ArsR/SmtB family transcription factor [Natronincola peptidivorans]SET28419.1 transcriptional regulator, ArsR family [Natronincola peptidivorans]
MNVIDIFKALGDETRGRIINLLIMGELCVCEIEAVLGITQSNASRHLNKLRSTGIITYEKKAQWVYYKIDSKFIRQHKLLYDYLAEILKKQYRRDTERLQKFKENNGTCEDIKQNINLFDIE